MAAIFKQFFPGLVIAALGCAQTQAQAPAPPPPHVSPSVSGSQSLAPPRPARANFRGDTAPGEVRRMADWVVASADNRSLPFVIIDKKDAEVFVFDSQGQIL